MGDADSNEISREVRALIAEHVDSVMALELLLFLAGDPGRRCTAAAAARELRIDPAWTASHLRAMASAGLLASAESQGPDRAAGPEFRYDPRTPELRQAVADLARAYADRRVTVIGLIFSKPADNLRNFADAFRLRKDKEKDHRDG